MDENYFNAINELLKQNGNTVEDINDPQTEFETSDSDDLNPEDSEDVSREPRGPSFLRYGRDYSGHQGEFMFLRYGPNNSL